MKYFESVRVQYKLDGNFENIAIEPNGDIWKVSGDGCFINAGTIESEYMKYLDYLTFAYKKEKKVLRFIRITTCSHNKLRIFSVADFVPSEYVKCYLLSQYNALIAELDKYQLFNGYSFYD